MADANPPPPEKKEDPPAEAPKESQQVDQPAEAPKESKQVEATQKKEEDITKTIDIPDDIIPALTDPKEKEIDANAYNFLKKNVNKKLLSKNAKFVQEIQNIRKQHNLTFVQAINFKILTADSKVDYIIKKALEKIAKNDMLKTKLAAEAITDDSKQSGKSFLGIKGTNKNATNLFRELSNIDGVPKDDIQKYVDFGKRIKNFDAPKVKELYELYKEHESKGDGVQRMIFDLINAPESYETIKDILNNNVAVVVVKESLPLKKKYKLSLIGAINVHLMTKNDRRLYTQAVKAVMNNDSLQVKVNPSFEFQPDAVAEKKPPLSAEAIKDAIQAFIRDIQSTSLLVSICVIISLFFTIISIIMAVVFTITSFKKLTRGLLVSNPVNEGSLDYNVAVSVSSWIPRGYNYIYFLVLPLLQALPLAIIGIYYFRGRKNPEFLSRFRVGSTMTLVMVVLAIQALICMLCNTIVYFNNYRIIRLVTIRVNAFDNYVYDRMYKGSRVKPKDVPKSEIDTYGKPSANSKAFYDELGDMQPNPISVKLAIQRALQKLPAEISDDGLAKAMFTASLYAHYHKLGTRNPSLYDAIDLFRPMRLMIRDMFNPADFLHRKGTYIDDMSETFGALNSMYLRPSLRDDQDKIASAIAKNAEWIAEANNRANNIYAEDAIAPFFSMVVAMFIVQLLFPMLIILYLSPADRRSALLKFLAKFIVGSTIADVVVKPAASQSASTSDGAR